MSGIKGFKGLRQLAPKKVLEGVFLKGVYSGKGLELRAYGFYA